MMGGYFLRYSDDEGATWSSRRYPVPFRLTSIDTHNEWNGTTTIGWSVDQLKVRDGVAYFAFTKIGKYLLGPPESLWVLKSANLLSPLCELWVMVAVRGRAERGKAGL